MRDRSGMITLSAGAMIAALTALSPAEALTIPAQGNKNRRAKVYSGPRMTSREQRRKKEGQSKKFKLKGIRP